MKEEKLRERKKKIMLDIKFVRENPEIVKQNIRNKFQDSKLPLVDEVIALDLRNREIKKEVEALRAEKIRFQKKSADLWRRVKRRSRRDEETGSGIRSQNGTVSAEEKRSRRDSVEKNDDHSKYH